MKSPEEDLGAFLWARVAQIIRDPLPIRFARGFPTGWGTMGVFMTALVDGFVGIVAGIGTAAVLFGGKLFLQKVVLPWYREKRYQGVLLEGEWFGVDEDDESSAEISLSLEQSAHELSGTLHIRHRSASNSFDLAFKVTGSIWEGYMTLNLRPASRQVTSYAAGFLKVAGGGTSLVGRLAHRDVDRDAVGMIPIFLSRGSRAHVSKKILQAKEYKQMEAGAAAAESAMSMISKRAAIGNEADVADLGKKTLEEVVPGS